MSSGRTLHQFQRSCWLSESTGGYADIRDSRTHQELADKEFSTATCGNVVFAPSFLSTPSMNPSRRTGKDVLAALAIFDVFAAYWVILRHSSPVGFLGP